LGKEKLASYGMIIRNRIFVVLAFLWQAAPAAGLTAGLGESAPSLPSDRKVVHSALQNSSADSSASQYTLYTVTTDGGTSVNEYASPQGTIFAVTWRGPMPPNLQQLFGTYYAQYQVAVAAAAASDSASQGDHRHQNLSNDDLVVTATARQRYYRGRAFVRSLVPSGVVVDDLP
jgi:hypothetical protein